MRIGTNLPIFAMRAPKRFASPTRHIRQIASIICVCAFFRFPCGPVFVSGGFGCWTRRTMLTTDILPFTFGSELQHANILVENRLSVQRP